MFSATLTFTPFLTAFMKWKLQKEQKSWSEKVNHLIHHFSFGRQEATDWKCWMWKAINNLKFRLIFKSKFSLLSPFNWLSLSFSLSCGVPLCLGASVFISILFKTENDEERKDVKWVGERKLKKFIFILSFVSSTTCCCLSHLFWTLTENVDANYSFEGWITFQTQLIDCN